MRTAGVTEIKASLSEVLARVKAGEEVLVTERGKPIARIVPLPAESLDSSMEDLVRAGVVRPPTRKLDEEFFRLPRPADPHGLALAALLEDRRSGR